MEAEASPERQIFGRLLAQVMQFPDEQDVHLVDGRPVLTFWGFAKDRAAVGSDPLRDLDRHIAEPSAAQPAQRGRHWWLWLLLTLLFLLLLGALLWALRGCDAGSSSDAAVPETEHSADERRLIGVESAPDAALDPEPAEDAGQVSSNDTFDLDAETDVSVIDDRYDDRRGLRVIERDGQQLVVGRDGKIVDLGDELIDNTGRTDLVDTDAVDKDLVGGDTVGAEGVDIDPTDAVVDQEDVVTVDPDEVFLDDADAALVEPALEEVEAGADAPADATETAEAAIDPEDAVAADNIAVDTEAVGDAVGSGEDQPNDSADGLAGSDAATADAAATTDAAGDANPAAPDTTAADPKATATDTGASSANPAGGSAALRIPSQQLLNSGWRTQTTLQDPKDGSPVRLDYRLKNGDGSIRLTRRDGSVCKSDATGTVREGRLVVESKQAILCTDGTSFGQPQIDCAPQAGGKASCVGRYADGTTFPIDMERQGP
jgi:hypothetical protein